MASSSGDVDFKALYQSSLKLTTAIDDFGIPRLEKGLEQLDDASRAFSHQQTTGKKRAAYSSEQHRTGGATRRSLNSKNSGIDKANFFLAAKGIDAEKLARDLQAFELAPSFAPETPSVGSTDIESYLTHHHEMIILTTIDDVNRRTMAATHDRMNTALIDDFERQKQRLLEDLGGAKALGIRNYPRVLTHDDRGNVFAALEAASDSQRSGNKQIDTIGLTGSNNSRRLALGNINSNARSDAPLRMSHLSTESALTDEMKLFARVVKELNASRVPHTRSQFDVVGAFERAAQYDVTSSVSGTKAEPVLKCWQLLRDMVTGGSRSGTTNRLSERAFADSKRDASPELQYHLAFGARVFLESQFRAFVFQTVQKHALATGGVPDLVSNVRAFVQFLQRSRYAAPSSNDDQTPTTDLDVGIWTLLYYCLRAGGDDEAIALATSSLRAGDDAVDAAVLTALTFRAQQKQQTRRLSDSPDALSSASPAVAFSKAHPTAFAALTSRLQRLTSASIDAVGVVQPFERCVVNLLCLGNANASEPRVLTTIEDYVWQRLCFIERRGTGGGSSADSNYTIARLAKSIQKFGPAHFEAAAKVSSTSNGNSVGAFLYFELLLVTQSFELAIQFIAAKGFLLDAVHFALALHHYGLVQTISNSSNMTDGDLEIENEEETGVTLDIARLVRQYVHAFQRTDASDAAEYIACLQDATAKRALLVELLLETRKFDALAGVTNSMDGCRTRGVLDRLLVDATEHDVKELLLTAARKAEARGRPHDALVLLKSAGDVEGVIELLTTQLSATLAATRTERDEWFRLAKDFCEHWLRFPWVQAIANRFARSVAVAFQLLLNVSIFLELVETQQVDDAIRFVDELGVLPTALGDSTSNTSVSVCVDRFLTLDERVRQTFHLLLLGYVECLVRASERVKTQLPAGETRRAAVRELRAKAEAVVTFAGMIKFRLPAGTNERLNRMESMIF